MEEAHQVYAAAPTDSALSQGEILDNVRRMLRLRGSGMDQPPEVEIVMYPYVVVLTQSCDLDLDYKVRLPESKIPSPEDKRLEAILLCPAYTDRLPNDSKDRKHFSTNNTERYQFLQRIPPELDLKSEGIGELTLDFKRYFSLTPKELYDGIAVGVSLRRAYLLSPYREHLVSRFFRYQSRVALPVPHRSV